MSSGNPVLRSELFDDFGIAARSDRMTVQGAGLKTLGLVGLLVLAGGISWTMATTNPAVAMPLIVVGAVGGLVLGLVGGFVPRWSPVVAPLYATAEGLLLGAISLHYSRAFYPGIVPQAAGLTVGTLFTMLTLYQMRIVQPTERFKTGILAATGGVALVYLVSFVLRLCGVQNPLHADGLIGIGFSVVVVAIAAFNLVLDFDFIEEGAARGAPKYLEWYGAFGLLVTLVWLYIEILRLLSKLNRR